MKGLLESKTYLSNPNSATATEAHAQVIILDEVNDILSVGLSKVDANAASTAEVFLESTNNNRMSSLVAEESKSKSPATLMKEASLLSYEAAVRDADSLSGRKN